MCDYSLGALPNRLAIDGEELIAYKFPTGSIGLASPADLCTARQIKKPVPRKTFWQAVKGLFELSPDSPAVPAVCVPPGAYLILKDVPMDLRREWGVREEEGVRFMQISADVNSYRDALQLPNGRQILLQDLREGTRLQILSSGGEVEENTAIPRQVVAR